MNIPFKKVIIILCACNLIIVSVLILTGKALKEPVGLKFFGGQLDEMAAILEKVPDEYYAAQFKEYPQTESAKKFESAVKQTAEFYEKAPEDIKKSASMENLDDFAAAMKKNPRFIETLLNKFDYSAEDAVNLLKDSPYVFYNTKLGSQQRALSKGLRMSVNYCLYNRMYEQAAACALKLAMLGLAAEKGYAESGPLFCYLIGNAHLNQAQKAFWQLNNDKKCPASVKYKAGYLLKALLESKKDFAVIIKEERQSGEMALNALWRKKPFSMAAAFFFWGNADSEYAHFYDGIESALTEQYPENHEQLKRWTSIDEMKKYTMLASYLISSCLRAFESSYVSFLKLRLTAAALILANESPEKVLGKNDPCFSDPISGTEFSCDSEKRKISAKMPDGFDSITLNSSDFVIYY